MYIKKAFVHFSQVNIYIEIFFYFATYFLRANLPKGKITKALLVGHKYGI